MIYHWQNQAGAHQLGRIVAEAGATVNDGVIYVLMQGHYDPHAFTWVPRERIKPYPSEPIPEPTK